MPRKNKAPLDQDFVRQCMLMMPNIEHGQLPTRRELSRMSGPLLEFLWAQRPISWHDSTEWQRVHDIMRYRQLI